MAVFGFDGIEAKTVLDTGRIVLICGNHQVFNNMLVDKLRASASGEDFLAKVIESEEEGDLAQYNAQIKLREELNAEFGIQEAGTKLSGFGVQSLDLETFFEVCKMPPVTGKWYCCVSMDFLTKKHVEKLERYIKKPSQYGLLIVLIPDYKDKKRYKSMQAIKSNPNAHLVDLSFPRRSMLDALVEKAFNNRGKKVAEAAVSLFVMRMGDSYDRYDEAVEKILLLNTDADVIDLAMVKQGLKGFDTVSYDEFISRLCTPMASKKIVARRKVYKEWQSLARDNTPMEITNRLKYRIADMIQYRININNGNIPVMGRYNAAKIKERIPENSSIKKKPDIVFKREAYMASKTSLADWYYMYIILQNAKGYDERVHMRAILNLMNRQTLSNDRLMNVIGVKDTLTENLVRINSTFYDENWLRLKRTEHAEGEQSDEEEPR